MQHFMYLKSRKKWNSFISPETYKSRADLRHYAKGVMTASKTGIVIVCIFICILLIQKMLQIHTLNPKIVQILGPEIFRTLN